MAYSKDRDTAMRKVQHKTLSIVIYLVSRRRLLRFDRLANGLALIFQVMPDDK
jgi:hypothetical protein